MNCQGFKKTKFLFIFTLLSLFLISCQNYDDSSFLDSSENICSSISDSEKESINSFNSSSENVNESINIDFNNDEVAIDLKNNKTYQRIFINNFNSKGEYFHSFTFDKIFFDNGGLKFGSSKEYGVLTFECVKNIKLITIIGRPYAKYDDYASIYRVDEYASIGVNDVFSPKCKLITNDDDYSTFNFHLDTTKVRISSKSIVEADKGRFVIKKLIIEL